jgi:hypothetical protein
MTLTDAERDRFAIYLEETAKDNELLVQQMESLPFAVPGLAKRYRVEALAAKVIASVLRKTRSEKEQ